MYKDQRNSSPSQTDGIVSQKTRQSTNKKSQKSAKKQRKPSMKGLEKKEEKKIQDLELREMAKKLAQQLNDFSERGPNAKVAKKVLYNGQEIEIKQFLKICSNHYQNCDSFANDFQKPKGK